MWCIAVENGYALAYNVNVQNMQRLMINKRMMVNKRENGFAFKKKNERSPFKTFKIFIILKKWRNHFSSWYNNVPVSLLLKRSWMN